MDLSVDYFKNLWSDAVKKLDARCNAWEVTCNEDTVPEDVLGEIRTAIGLAKLLKSQKLKQFRGLVDDSEFKTGEKEITLVDLQGFWDMVFFEVEKIEKSFKNLEDCKNNDWKFPVQSVMKVPKKKIQKSTQPKKVVSTAHAEAAKQRLADVKKKMMAHRQQNKKHTLETPVLISTPVLATKNSQNEETSNEILPSPSKIAKIKPSPNKLVENICSPRKAVKSKASPMKNAKNKSAQKKLFLQSKENTPTDEQVKKTQRSKEKKEKNYETYEKPLTRSAKKALVAKQEVDNQKL